MPTRAIRIKVVTEELGRSHILLIEGASELAAVSLVRSPAFMRKAAIDIWFACLSPMPRGDAARNTADSVLSLTCFGIVQQALVRFALVVSV